MPIITMSKKLTIDFEFQIHYKTSFFNQNINLCRACLSKL